MHDGRFATLEEVVDFYSDGVVFSNTIDPLMKKVEHREFTYNCKIIHYMSDMHKLHYKID